MGGSSGPKMIIFIEIVNCGHWTLDIHNIMNADRIPLELVTLRAQASPLSLQTSRNRIIFT